jgi:hypothetical protein
MEWCNAATEHWKNDVLPLGEFAGGPRLKE